MTFPIWLLTFWLLGKRNLLSGLVCQLTPYLKHHTWNENTLISPYYPLLCELTLQCTVYFCRHGLWLAVSVHTALWLASPIWRWSVVISPGRCSKVSLWTARRDVTPEDGDVTDTKRGQHWLPASDWPPPGITGLWLAGVLVRLSLSFMSSCLLDFVEIPRFCRESRMATLGSETPGPGVRTS